MNILTSIVSMTIPIITDTENIADRSNRINEYELLLSREKRKDTTDPEVEKYFKAKELYVKGFGLASKIPEDSEEETLRKHEQEILESTQFLVEAFLLDDKATEMSPRIMSLAQQYENLLKLGEDGEKKEIEEKIVENTNEEILDEKKIDKDHREDIDTLEPEFTRE
ncbi:5582_t:CDS:2 [Acaulospora colombiana]|uniref:5582_t:CDS:1 n=1 Tax=Acaulospora colombiana TaxID=27376 RepID=A0ACA9L0M2_9GLOM|nr:5582_t:CDS:2 [Acaulospora colombiana]